MNFLKDLVKQFVPPPLNSELPFRDDEVTVKKSVVAPLEVDNNTGVFNHKEDNFIEDLDIFKSEELPSMKDSFNSSTTNTTNLSLFGKELEKALNNYGVVNKKIPLNAEIFLEDTHSEKHNNMTIYYARYNDDVKPHQFINLIKDNGAFITDLNATLISGGIKIEFANQGILKVSVIDGRV